MSNYVVSDIHGCYDRYQKMLKEINFNDNDTLYVIGDVIDRWDGSIEILKDMMKRPNVIMFLGNHEYMMLEYLELTNNLKNKRNHIWLSPNNGGDITLQKFEELSSPEQKQIVKYLKESYVQKFITVDNVDYVLCHAFYHRRMKDVLFNDIDLKTLDMLVWYSPLRDDYLYVPPTYYDENYYFITGHVPVINPPYSINNIFFIDGGCSARRHAPEVGCLCCIKLENFMNDNREVFKIV